MPQTTPRELIELLEKSSFDKALAKFNEACKTEKDTLLKWNNPEEGKLSIMDRLLLICCVASKDGNKDALKLIQALIDKGANILAAATEEECYCYDLCFDKKHSVSDNIGHHNHIVDCNPLMITVEPGNAEAIDVILKAGTKEEKDEMLKKAAYGYNALMKALIFNKYNRRSNIDRHSKLLLDIQAIIDEATDSATIQAMMHLEENKDEYVTAIECTSNPGEINILLNAVLKKIHDPEITLKFILNHVIDDSPEIFETIFENEDIDEDVKVKMRSLIMEDDRIAHIWATYAGRVEFITKSFKSIFYKERPEEIKEILLKKDGDGDTPLGCAIFYNNIKGIKALIEAGKDTGNLKEMLLHENNDGETPLMLAVKTKIRGGEHKSNKSTYQGSKRYRQL